MDLIQLIDDENEEAMQSKIVQYIHAMTFEKVSIEKSV